MNKIFEKHPLPWSHSHYDGVRIVADANNNQVLHETINEIINKLSRQQLQQLGHTFPAKLYVIKKKGENLYVRGKFGSLTPDINRARMRKTRPSCNDNYEVVEVKISKIV